MPKIEGGCLCGSVRYTSDAEPITTVICNCKNCQRSTGTAFSVIFAVPKGSLKMQGAEPDAYNDKGESGMAVRRRFCSRCGSPIFSEVEVTPTMDWVKAGTLDDTSWLKPQANIWCDSAQAWVKMSDELPKAPQNPEM